MAFHSIALLKCIEISPHIFDSFYFQIDDVQTRFSLVLLSKRFEKKSDSYKRFLSGRCLAFAVNGKKIEFVCENVEWENLPDLVTLTALFYNFTQLGNAISIYRVLQRDETKCNVPPFFLSSNFSEIILWNLVKKNPLMRRY